MKNSLDPLFSALARLLVARGVLFSDTSERMKGGYVQAAIAKTEVSQQSVTDSRISVLTGLQRRDISRLRAFEAKPSRTNPLIGLVALWQYDPRYQVDGEPMTLPRNGPEPSFESLANEIRKDVHPRSMLDALLAAGTVELIGDCIRLVQTSYQPLPGSDAQIADLSQNLGDYMSAATENVLADTPRHFERAVHYGGLSNDDIAELNAIYRAGQMKLFEIISERPKDAIARRGRENSKIPGRRLLL